MTNELLDEDFTLKVKGAVYATRHAYPYLKQGGGAICNTTTPGGKAARGGSQPTSMSRAAGISLTKTWAHEFAQDGIRVNTVCVGLFKSRQHRRRWESKHDTQSDYTLDNHWTSLGAGVPLAVSARPAKLAMSSHSYAPSVQGTSQARPSTWMAVPRP